LRQKEDRERAPGKNDRRVRNNNNKSKKENRRKIVGLQKTKKATNGKLNESRHPVAGSQNGVNKREESDRGIHGVTGWRLDEKTGQSPPALNRESKETTMFDRSENGPKKRGWQIETSVTGR